VEISKMLLGPLPEGFEFVPKHKSSSYPAQATSTGHATTSLPVSDDSLHVDPVSAAVGEEWGGEVE
jgi:hypothetical protein